MKNITLILFTLAIISNACAQIGLSSEKWQADLKFLQETVHKDYPFLFKKTTAEAFDKEVETLYKQIPELDRHEIITGIARIVSSFQYGHTSVGLRGAPANFHQLPFNLYHFKDGVFIEGVHKDYQKALGAKVVAIESTPVEKALKLVHPVVPSENDQFFKAFGVNYLRNLEILHAQGIIKDLDRKVTVNLEKDGESFDITFQAVQGQQFPIQYSLVKPGGNWLSVRDQGQTPYYLKDLDRIYYFAYLKDQKAVYVRQSQIQDDPNEIIPAFYDRVFHFIENNDVEKLILDVRLNGGGNNYKNKPVVTGIIRSEKINQTGKLFVIIGRRTFSACQNLVNELDNYTNAIFVGEPTAENINFYGDNRKVVLPNSELPVFLSFAWWQDKPQWENADWTAPQVAVEMSFDEYRTNQDPVLDAALNFSSDDFVLDPLQYFTDLFLAGKFEQLEKDAISMVKDPKYSFFDFEAEFNKAGYNLLNGGQMEGAMYVFEFNTRLFPESANAWDSLGEAHWKAKKIDKAIELYKKAISLDPEGPIGENARKMLKQIEMEH